MKIFNQPLAKSRIPAGGWERSRVPILGGAPDEHCMMRKLKALTKDRTVNYNIIYT